MQDGENPVSASDDVTFYWEHPIEKLEAGEDELTIQVGEQASLPIVYTPQQPSQALITWTQEGDGEVEVTRGVNSEYDWFSNTNYYVTGVKEGTVTITGTPAAAAEGTSPSVTFTIHVGSGGEKPVLPDTTELVSTWKASIQKYYEGSEPSWTYGMEWNIIALERAGIDMGVDKEAYLASVKEELADEYGDLTADGKPTDLERTALAMYALGLDPRNIEMEDGSTVDLIQWILDSERISEGTNEAAYALLAVDANAVNIPEGSRWNRDTLMEELLSFQADDGSFVLSKPVSGTGSIDMTAMSLQALSRYTDREDVQAAVDKALDYLKRNINMGDYGTVESNDQVILTLLMLGIAPSDDDSGFTSWGANIFTATDEYRIESGGFAHTKGGAVNEMATQQTLLAVAAWERFAAGENDIYDMTDVMGGEEPEEAQAVIDLIDQIGTVTLENREAIEAARNAYDALTEEQQSYVTNYSVLTAAEAELKALEEQAAADAVTEQINSLPAADALTLEDKAAVEAAREAYEALTGNQKALVTEETVQKLANLEAKIAELTDDAEAAAEVEQEIVSLPSAEELTLEDAPAVKTANAHYEALTDEQKSLISADIVEKLQKAVEQMAILEEQAADQAAADAVTEQINSLPAADTLTLADKAAVEAAREAYEALTDAQKQYVTEETMAVLEKCENRIQELESAENPDGPDVTPTPTPDEEVTLTYQNYPISVTGKGLSGWKLRLEALTAFDSDVKLMQKEITSKEALIRLYSAALYKDGQEVQPEGEITLNIQVGEKYNGKTLKVLHVADGKVETLTGTVTEGVLKVTVSTLGKFGTVVDASTVSTGDTGNGSGSGTGSSTAGGAAGTGSVQTGDETDLLPYVSALILAVGAGIVLAVFSRKRSTAEK